MTCEEFRAYNPDWPTFKRQAPEVRLQCAKHANQCPACDEWATEQGKTASWTPQDTADAVALAEADLLFEKNNT